MMTRRHAIKTTALTAAAVAFGGRATHSCAQPAAAPGGPFQLPPLPYAFDALEPHLDARTMEIHHNRHHAAYVTNLNRAVADQPTLASKTIEDLIRGLEAVPEAVRTVVRNHGGGHLNHTLFWQMMAKDGGGPKGDLARAIEKKFGSFDTFKAEFTKAATGVFGSGWAWLTLDLNKELRIETTPNQDSPLTAQRTPLLGIDVWEHAYYLKYQNRRPDYIAAWWHVVNWDFVAEQFRKAAA